MWRPQKLGAAAPLVDVFQKILVRFRVNIKVLNNTASCGERLLAPGPHHPIFLRDDIGFKPSAL